MEALSRLQHEPGQLRVVDRLREVGFMHTCVCLCAPVCVCVLVCSMSLANYA